MGKKVVTAASAHNIRLPFCSTPMLCTPVQPCGYAGMLERNRGCFDQRRIIFCVWLSVGAIKESFASLSTDTGWFPRKSHTNTVMIKCLHAIKSRDVHALNPIPERPGCPFGRPQLSRITGRSVTHIGRREDYRPELCSRPSVRALYASSGFFLHVVIFVRKRYRECGRNEICQI